jgi:hypothetical protein
MLVDVRVLGYVWLTSGLDRDDCVRVFCHCSEN